MYGILGSYPIRLDVKEGYVSHWLAQGNGKMQMLTLLNPASDCTNFHIAVDKQN